MKKQIVFFAIIICLLIFSKVYAESGNGYIVKLKGDAVALMCNDANVTHIADNLYYAQSMEDIENSIEKDNIEVCFPDCEMELFEADYPEITSDTYFAEQWYLSKIEAEAVREKGLTGRNVRICVIDSGFNSAHADFDASNVSEGYNCVIGAEDKNDYTDNVGHGTMVAGLIGAKADNELGIAGLADNVEIIPIKITDKSSFGVAAIIAGLEKALECECDIINMSLGGPISDRYALAELKSYIDEAERRGIIVCAAVGNSRHVDNSLNYPAAFQNVIGVGSVDDKSVVSYFSQSNESVLVTAPGESILTLSSNGGLRTASGTSLAAPIVTASIAHIKEVLPDATVTDVINIIRETSVDAGQKGYDIYYGYGILNLKNIVDSLKSDIDDFIITQGQKASNKRLYVHNNTIAKKNADLFFASYEGGLTGVSIMPKLELECGVNIFGIPKSFDVAFLWNDCLRPYSDKYLID